MFHSDYFDPGYWASGYWGDDAGEAPIGSVTVNATLDGVVGRIELVTVVATEIRGGGGGYVRRQDVERMERHLRESKVRMRGQLAGVSGRFIATHRLRAAVLAVLEGVSGRAAVRHTYAAEVYEEDEDWLVLL